MRVALVIGRFQPFHLGHLKAIRKILQENDSVLLLIGSSQFSRTAENPFTYEERKGMILDCLKQEGLMKRVKIIPLRDENDHEKWVEKVAGNAFGASALYSGNELVRKLLGAKFEVRTMESDVEISGTQIREMIKEGKERWKGYVPVEISNYLMKRNLLKFV